MNSNLNIRWFPASWVLIEYDGKILYIDPAWVQHNFDKHPGKVIYSHYPEPMDGLPEPNMPKADIILVTHNHQDHIKTATLHRLLKDTTQIIAPSNCNKLIDIPFDRITPGEMRQTGPFTIDAVYAYNTADGHSTHKPHKREACVGYVVAAGNKRIYHAGDTDIIPEMLQLGQLDVAMLPVGGTFTMDLDEAIACAEKLKPKLFIPMHFLHVTKEQALSSLKKCHVKYRLPNIGEVIEL